MTPSREGRGGGLREAGRQGFLGAIFQVLAIVMYVVVSPQRTPPYEPWGILIKVLQVAILAALVYLVVRQPVRRTARAWRSV